MGPDGVLHGEIAHIEGALPDSCRFNVSMTNEERRAYDNLLIMCENHHTTIDDPDVGEKIWPVDRLQRLKKDHEAIYTSVPDQLRRQVGDISEGVTYTPANNGLVVLEPLGLGEDEQAESCEQINQFAERLTRVPEDARSLLAVIVDRGDEVPANWAPWEPEFSVPAEALHSYVDCGPRELRRHIEVLEHCSLMRFEDHVFDGPPVYVVGNCLPGSGWQLLQDIRRAVDGDRATLRRIFCHLDFTALDT
ncbi:hypothetical protein [Mycobacterium sp. M26]|uniref:hypothetical protein n=1 Tax=Mycobacterium sp. M26 TaxID=1762962 RepID=UPI0018D264D2|nr:hypothetical protein [Mycobacterium sp. M26]